MTEMEGGPAAGAGAPPDRDREQTASRDAIVYNVPAGLVERYRGKDVIVRCDHPREIEGCLSQRHAVRLSHIQLSDWTPEAELFHSRGISVPVDLVLTDPGSDCSLLYAYATLLSRHPLRVTIPVVAGCGKAARLAASLNLAVKLDVAQPGEEEVVELLDVADRYLHQTTVSQPIEYFHGVLVSLIHGTPTTLWNLQEEDPDGFRYVTDAGEELLSRRMPECGQGEETGRILDDLARELRAGDTECAVCDFFDVCRGYFKRPRQDYSCAGVKEVFRVLRAAADELREALASCDGEAGEVGE